MKNFIKKKYLYYTIENLILSNSIEVNLILNFYSNIFFSVNKIYTISQKEDSSKKNFKELLINNPKNPLCNPKHATAGGSK